MSIKKAPLGLNHSRKATRNSVNYGMRWFKILKTAISGRQFHEIYEKLAPHYGPPEELSYGTPWEEESSEYQVLMTRIFEELHQDKEFKTMDSKSKAQSFHSLFEEYGPDLPAEDELMLGKTLKQEPTTYQKLLTKVFDEL